MTTLETLDPETALQLYLQDKESEQSKATQYSHKSRLGHFLRWCDEHEITNLNDLTGRELQRYKLWRRDDGNLNNVTLKTQMDTIRVFIRWCETIDAVEQDLSTKVQSPTLANGENQRETQLDSDTADAALSYLEKYEYGSLKYVIVAVLWQTMMRRGAIRALDCDDYDRATQVLRVRHRPKTDTPIKNKQQGERTPSHEDKMRERIRDRVFNTIERDTMILYDLDPELRREIFRKWENRDYPDPVRQLDFGRGIEGSERLGRSQFHIGLQALITFIYLGVEDGNVGDFEDILTGAINKAVRDRGKYVKDVEIKFGELETLNDIYGRLTDGTFDLGELTVQEAQVLVANGCIDLNEVPERFQDIIIPDE